MAANLNFRTCLAAGSMPHSRPQRGLHYPVIVWVVLLAMVFVVEYGLMHVLPWVLGANASRAIESLADSVVLTLLIAPALWWTIVRPLTEVLRLREEFLSDLFEQIERDRRQTARDLHDGVGQSLTLLISGLRSSTKCRDRAECGQRVNDFIRLANDALSEVRRLALGLRPSVLDDLGLAPALERLVEDVRTRHPVDIALEVISDDERPASKAVATAVFRIIQEALANVIKHSSAKRVRIRVRQSEDDTQIEIEDDGRGIEPSRLSSLPAGHLGIRGMRERSVLLGGDFQIDAPPGKGTRLKVTIPSQGGPE